MSSPAPGATPVPSPRLEPAPVPATVSATWVPWPLSSTAASEVPVKSCAPLTWPSRSGCVGSYPESSTATVAPVPSYPCAQASGAWICGTLSSSVDRTVPFSHTLPAPASRASVALRSACSPRSDSQTSRISSFAPSTATMPTESRTCTLSAASGVAGARLASGPPRPWSSSGSSALESSSRRLLTSSVTLNRFSSSAPDCTYGSASAGTTCTWPSCS